MLNLYKVSFDVKIGREWIGSGCEGGSALDSMNILESNALSAGNKARKRAMADEIDGSKPKDVRISEIELIASRIS